MDFSLIALLFILAAGAGFIAKLLRQPLLVGYLFAGVFAVLTGMVHDTHDLESLSKVGVTLLLFLVGLEMNIKELPSLGKVALTTGMGQIIFTSLIGFGLSLGLGFSPITSIYIAIALTFSSTIIIIKLLSERNDLSTLYGKVSVGFLLVQDFVAVVLLMLLAGLSTEGTITALDVVLIFAKAAALLSITTFLSRKLLPYTFDRFFAGNSEILFVVSIAWALGIASLVGGPLGLSIEIGGFLAGLALSGLPEHLQIASKTRPLRDFFLTIFFVVLGTQLVVGNIAAIILPALAFSLFVLIGNPLIVLILMGLLGYRKKVGFFAGLTVAQISEFSLILMAMGASVGHVSQNDIAVVILVAIFTMTGSTYMILGADKIYKWLEKPLSIFERKRLKTITLEDPILYKDHIVLVGADRTGSMVLSFLKKSIHDVIVVDFNPVVIASMQQKNVPAVFGDITDLEILQAVDAKEARTVISTTSRLADNLVMLSYLKKSGSKATTILTAKTRKEAVAYYKAGAHYVILPETLAGEHIRHVMKVHGVSSGTITRMGKSHWKRLGKY